MRSSQNALVHGACSAAIKDDAKKLNELLRMLRNLGQE